MRDQQEWRQCIEHWKSGPVFFKQLVARINSLSSTGKQEIEIVIFTTDFCGINHIRFSFKTKRETACNSYPLGMQIPEMEREIEEESTCSLNVSSCFSIAIFKHSLSYGLVSFSIRKSGAQSTPPTGTAITEPFKPLHGKRSSLYLSGSSRLRKQRLQSIHEKCRGIDWSLSCPHSKEGGEEWWES